MELSFLRRSGGGCGYVKTGYYPAAVAVAVLVRRAPEKRAARWRALWRRVKKIRVLSSCGGAREAHVPYNPQTYMQNFDEGSVMVIGDDPDAVSRSFSARFAILQRPADFVVHKVKV